eukprot:TRINITY_DN2657_c0_g1_i2.p1 TRINITY_DN2657_c0_g1~~TRINITY_DN2657_c0_g1_i2.p1  ORF type:complete len:139 (-),score=37.82 TRINITY_DN2657_c0_g1_i2:317-688(-)
MIRNIIKAVGLVGEKQFIFFLNSMFDKSVSLNEKMKNLCSLLAALSNIPNAQEELQSLLSSSRIRLVEITAENIDEMSGIYSYIILVISSSLPDDLTSIFSSSPSSPSFHLTNRSIDSGTWKE